MKIRKSIPLILILLLTLLFTGSDLFAQEVIQANSAKILFIDGTVKVKKEKSEKWVTALNNYVLEPGDELKTGKETCCLIMLLDESTVKLGDETHIKIDSLGGGEGGKSKFKLFTGKIWNQVTKAFNKKSSFEVEAPYTLAAVKGTIFEIRSDGKSDELYVYEGSVEAMNEEAAKAKPMMVSRDQVARFNRKGLIGKMLTMNKEEMNPWQKWNLAIDTEIMRKRNQTVAMAREKYPSGSASTYRSASVARPGTESDDFPMGGGGGGSVHSRKLTAQQIIQIRGMVQKMDNPFTKKKVKKEIHQQKKLEKRENVKANLIKDMKERLEDKK